MKIDRRTFGWLRWGRSSQALLILGVMLGLAGGALAALQARSLAQIIAGIFLEDKTLSQFTIPLGLLLGIVLARAITGWGQEVAASAAAIRIKTRLRQELYEHILALGPSFTRGERSGELVNTAFEGVETLQAYFGQYLPQLVLAALLPLLFLIFILPLDWLSVVVLIVTAPLMPIFMILIGSTAETLTRRQWKTLSRTSAYFLDVLQGITTLKAFRQARTQVRVISRLSEVYTRTTMQVLRITFLSALALEMLSTLGTAVVAVEVGLRLLYGRLGFEEAFFILLLAPEFYMPLRLLGGRFHAGMAGVNAAERILDILERPVSLAPVHPSLPSMNEVQGENLQKPERLVFEHVHYAYPGTPMTLSDISFEVHSGQRVALVGSSGAGKSTLAALLLRFIEPESGRIMLDGKEMDQVQVEDWRQNIAWVPQRPYLFNDSLQANIRIARPDASQDDIHQAARLAHADEFIDRLPQGYETIIGERGYNLSAGQAQRVALARAFLKNAPILILDEATSNLDPRLEALVGDSLEQLMAGRIVLIIAHRMATAARADRILVLDGGHLVETGTHESLLKQGGFYKQLLGEVVESTPITPETGRAFPLTSEPYRAQILPGPLPAPQEVGSGEGVIFWRLLRLIYPFTGWIALAVLLGALTVGSGIGLMAASAYLISAAALHPSISVLQVAIVGVRAFGIARGLFRYLERYVSHKVTFQVLGRLRTWFYQALEPLAPARLMSYRSGDLLSRVMSDFAELENFYVRALAPPLVALVIAATTTTYVGSFSTALAGIYLSTFILGGFGVTWLALALGRRPGRQIVALRSSLSATMLDGILGLADLLAMSAEKRFMKDFISLDERLAAAQMRMVRRAGLVTALNGLVAGLGMWVLLVQAIPKVSAGSLPGVYLASILLAALASFEATQPLPMAAQYLENQLAAAGRLFELVTAEPAVREPDQPVPPPIHGDIWVEGLSFAYQGTRPAMNGGASLALEDLNFYLPQGGRLAVVGPSGAGKTTLTHLLLRFWEYNHGSIRLGERELHSYRGDDVRRAFSLVSQHTDLFNMTIRENLLIARPDASPEMIFTAARGAQIHDFILSLPEGYDTWIGEQGLRLSGGERQRLAVARALLKDAPLLLLDEPTANLDPLTERRLLDSLLKMMEGRTTLLITHRLVGLEAMDEILVLDHGRTVERGIHAELIQAGGFYRRMWELQNQILPGTQDHR